MASRRDAVPVSSATPSISQPTPCVSSCSIDGAATLIQSLSLTQPLAPIPKESSKSDPASFRPFTLGSPRTYRTMALTFEAVRQGRYRDWVRANGRTVAKWSSEAVGYVHLPDMEETGRRMCRIKRKRERMGWRGDCIGSVCKLFIPLLLYTHAVSLSAP